MLLPPEKILSYLLPINAFARSRDSLKRQLVAETLRQFSEVRFVAHGTSMLPSIYPGDCLVITAFASAPPRRGDVVLSLRSSEFRVHRIVDILTPGPAPLYMTRGDALLEDDPPVPSAELLGRVTALLRHGKPVAVAFPDGLGHRFLRYIVRRSRAAALLLLGWHALLSRAVPHTQTLPAKPASPKTECA